MPSVTISINGKNHTAREGSTILEACADAGVDIPVLCYHPRLRIAGNCRVCCVEVEGCKTLMPACVTPITPNMVVRTDSPGVIQARRTIVDLLLAAHNCDCLVCDEAGNCQLQKMAYELGLDRRSRAFLGCDEDLPDLDV